MMMRIISLTLCLFLSACVTRKHTYLKYAGYIEGCHDATVSILLVQNPGATEDMLDQSILDSMCMEMYLIKLNHDNLEPPKMKRLDRNEMINYEPRRI